MSGSDDSGERVALGHALAAARESRGLSVAQVAAAINLRATVVRAIEDDDFSLCGGDVYARGHLRAYARQVGLDAGPLVEAYRSRSTQVRTAPTAAAASPTAGSSTAGSSTGSSKHAGPTTVGSADRTRAADGASDRTGRGTVQPALAGRRFPGSDGPLERSGPNLTLLAGGALAVLLVFLGVQLVNDLRGPGRSSRPVAGPVVPTTAPSAPTRPAQPTPSTPPPTRPVTPTPAPGPAAPGVAVGLQATASTWVSVRTAAGRTVFSGLMSKGDARRFTDDKQLRLTLGNAGAVQLTVNGKPLGSAGGDGQVVKLRFGPGDPA